MVEILFDEVVEKTINILRKAGERVLECYTSVDFSLQKSEHFPVTIADMDADRIIISGLKENYNDIPILTEETDCGLNRLENDYVFVVDPLDGTKDFVNKTGDFSLMISLLHNGYPVFGIVHMPLLKKTYYAFRGQGAFCLDGNGIRTRLSVSKTKQYSKISILTSRYKHPEIVDRLVKRLDIKSMIPMGSAGIKMAEIASGRADVYISPSNKTGEWDSAAGTILVEEAGGKVTDINGNILQFGKKDPHNLNGFLVSNGIIHDEIVGELKK